MANKEKKSHSSKCNGVVLIKKDDNNIKSSLLKPTMAKTSCCRGERA